MASLPNSDRALIDERKLIEYALNPGHPRGGDKARQFAAALGYDRSNSDILVSQMRKALGAHEAVLVRQDGYGRHYRVDLTLAGPRGRRRFKPDGSSIEEAMSQGSPRRTSCAAAAGQGAEPLALFDVVRVLRAVPEYGLAGGEEGTVVEILDDPNRAYLVDFSSGSADRSDSELPVYPLSAELIMPVSKVRRAAVT